MSRVGALGPAPQPVRRRRLIAITIARERTLTLAPVIRSMAVILPGKSEKSEFVNWNYPRFNAEKCCEITNLLLIYRGFFESELAGRIIPLASTRGG